MNARQRGTPLAAMSIRCARTFAGCCLLSIAAQACAPARPGQELLLARQSFARVSGGEVPVDAMDSVERARRALSEAETAATDGRDSEEARDLAYVALRRAELVEAQARIAAAARRRDAALARTHAEPGRASGSRP